MLSESAVLFLLKEESMRISTHSEFPSKMGGEEGVKKGGNYSTQKKENDVVRKENGEKKEGNTRRNIRGSLRVGGQTPNFRWAHY